LLDHARTRIVKGEKTSPTVMFGKDGGLNVRLHPRVIGLSQDGFSWVVLKQLTQNLKLIPIIV
jgi:hypothetical protein